ncbi:MAG: acyl-phosphate glycerol 3-phosphate acyltransferase [Gammaproteobacteria bacterium]|nr:MAG: acyl-phosphate glycerol 3-phosphate acyltransferase [Gammaproteobacteria bacterium]
MPVIEITVLIFAYLLGSISSAIIICKLMGMADPREVGSHNPGATNVLRIGGRKAAILTFAFDVLKGVIPVLVAKYFDFSILWLSGVVAATFLGHCLPIFFSFQGGKGVATAFGALTTMNWQIGLVILIVWVIVFMLFRISSLAGISSASAIPIATWYFSVESVLPMTIMALLMIWRHQDNIKGLLSGDEQRLGGSD